MIKFASLISVSAACMVDTQCGNEECCLFNACAAYIDIGCQNGRYKAFEKIKLLDFDEIKVQGLFEPCVEESAGCQDLLANVYN